MELQLSFKYQETVADVGYESEGNYLFYEISKTRKYKWDIGRMETWSMWKKATIIIAKTNRD